MLLFFNENLNNEQSVSLVSSPPALQPAYSAEQIPHRGRKHYHIVQNGMSITYVYVYYYLDTKTFVQVGTEIFQLKVCKWLQLKFILHRLEG